MRKLFTSIFFTILTHSILAQDYHELSRPERQTVSCFQVMDLNDGTLLSLEDHGYVENGEWINQGAYLMKINDKAELLDSLFIEFPHKINNSAIIQNPLNENCYIFADFYLNTDDFNYYYKAVFFDNDLNVTDVIDKHIPCSSARLCETHRKPFLGIDNNWIVSSYDSNNNYVFLEISIWGDLVKEKVSDICMDNFRRVNESLFIYDKEEKLYGFFCVERVEDAPNWYNEDQCTLFILDQGLKKIATHSFYKIGNNYINSIRDPAMIVKESGELVMVFTSYNNGVQITEFDKNMNIVKSKTIDKDAGVLGYSHILIQLQPIAIREDGSMYISWYLYYRDEDYTQHFVTLLDKDFNIKWEQQYYECYDATAMGMPRIVDMQTLSNGNLAIAGTNIYDYSIPISSYPYVVIFEDNSSSTSEQPSLIRPYSFYPNPARDFIKLSAVSGQLSAVRVYNTLGMLVEEFEMQSNEIDINISDYKSGMYFINISTDNGDTFTEKVVVR